MTERRNDNAAFAKLAARRRQERADTLTLAKREAAERGKQLFDLDKLETLYDTHSPGGFQDTRERRELDYEYRYYVDYAETMNLAEYAAKQEAHDAGTEARPPRGPAQIAARAQRARLARLDLPSQAGAPKTDALLVAGVEISSAAEVAELVERQLEVGGVWSDRADYNEVDGLRRAMRDAGPLSAAFGEALLNPWPADEGRAVVAQSFWNTLPISEDERAELKGIISPTP